MSKKVIVVGFGFMGQTHARNIANHPNLELAAIVDAIDPKIAMKKSTGNLNTNTLGENVISKVPYYKELTEAIAEVKPDAVVVATPTMLHYKFAKIVLEAGCNLFLEKPICLDPNLCDELVALAESKHLVFMAGHCVRFQKEFLFIKELVEKQTYGKPVYFHYSRYCGVPGWGSWTDPEVSAKSGGAMYDMAIHDTDCARALFGNPDEIAVMPYLRDRFGLMVVDTCWKYNNGPIVRVEAGFQPPHTMPFHKEFTAIFENATINCDMRGMTISTSEGVKPVELKEVDCYEAEMAAFAEYLEKGEMPLECSGKDATATIRICTRFFNNKG
ncbi:MAG: Gfo/Idh/MocA family oxidoreductase [Victivallales bacterium]|nr:Gfo/Idh/MocA family oxidoreductase [Victivallales bacterium]